MARRPPAGTPAMRELDRAGVPYSVHAFEPGDASGTSYGEQAAAALDLAPALVFKTLLAAVDGALTVAVVPVAGHLDLKALAAARGGKRAVMAEPAAAERATGYVVGGISPFGQRRRLPTVLDRTALALERIYVSGGRRGLDLGVAPDALVTLLAAQAAPISRS